MDVLGKALDIFGSIYKLEKKLTNYLNERKLKGMKYYEDKGGLENNF